jgi:glycogen synthase
MAAVPLRILMVCAKYLPLIGGTELHVREMATRLVALGHDVTVLTTVPDRSLAGTSSEDGVTVIRVRAWGSGRDLFFAPGIRRIIRQGDWNVVHCQGFHTLVGPMAMLAARHGYVVTFHRGVHSSRLRRAVTSLQARLLRPLFARAAGLVSVSRFEAGTFSRELGLPLDRFHVIPNASRLELVHGLEPATEPVLVSVGRLERYKGHWLAVAALPHVLARRPDARLRIIGSGPREQELRDLADELGVGDRVSIEAIPPDEPAAMSTALQQAALVVVLSDYESQSLAVLEALALKRPTLVRYTGANGEYADAGLVRAVSKDAGPADIAAAVVDLLERPFEPADIALPDWDECVERLLDVYALAERA